jgi:putative membrane-bound dehydrogenase-like protein
MRLPLLLCWLGQASLICCVATFAVAQSAPVTAIADREELIFTPAGFDQPGQPAIAEGEGTGELQIVVRDQKSGRPIPCRVNVVGPDGNFYEPQQNALTQYSLTGEWPKWPKAWGNRPGKAPFRYFGRFFYATGEATVRVPAGQVRVEAWKGFEYRPGSVTTIVPAGERRSVEVTLSHEASATQHGYYSGDPHIHIPRTSEQDDTTTFDLMEAEDIHYASLLGYNEPAGPYAGFMDKLDSPQRRGMGRESIRTRGDYHLLSGQEYRTGTYGHLNLFLRDDIVFPGQSFNADNWPLYGEVGRDTQDQGGYAFYAHGGYAQAIYADFVQGNVNGVELLQFGVYRGIGLVDWYNILNIGYRFPCVGASDYPACRMLGDCRTFVELPEDRSFPAWLKGAAAGRSFVSTAPVLLLDVDGQKPGDIIRCDAGPVSVTARVRVKSVVAPVTNVQLIVNGAVVQAMSVAAEEGQHTRVEFETPLTITEPSWIAARAYSESPGGAADAEAHTNPVYVYLDGKAPYRRESLDAIVGEIDKQIAAHSKRTFPEQAQVLAYFQRSRDILLAIRSAGGLRADADPRQLAQAAAKLEVDGSREPTEDELKEFLKPVPPLPPDEALRAFDMLDGFEMQLVAAEPLVCDPIAAAFDENGNLYVCEMRDYPYRPAEGGRPIGRVSVLRDVDGDGTFDESHLFADELLWAGGVAPWKGGVFVAAPPDIWYFKDTDGDFVADVREKRYTGFGVENQQAMLNNLQLGLDFRIYGSTAGNGGAITTVGDPEAGVVSVSGRDFRFDPVSGRFESITGTVQFGSTFDDWGNRFLCSESQPLHHVVLPQEYLERNPYLPVASGIQNIATGPVPIFRISPIERWRHIRSSRRIAAQSRPSTSAGASHHVIDAAAGVTVYRGGAYPPEFYGQVFIADGQNNLVHRRRLIPDGVTFRSERVDDRTEFCRSSDIWFRPVNFVNAPDGTLYVLDMSREVLETIHIPLDVVRHLDLASGRDRGRVYRMAPTGFRSAPPPRLGSASAQELLAALENPHGWWRDTAHRLIYERQDLAAVGPLRTLLRSGERPQARLHALWLLQGLHDLETNDLLAALNDSSPVLREHAVRLSENRLDAAPVLLERVLALASDADPRVRFQVAFSLGASSSPRAAEMLAEIARREGSDHWMWTAVLSSLAGPAEHVLQELLGDTAFTTKGTGRNVIAQVAGLIGARHDAAEIERVLDAVARHPKTARHLELQSLVLHAMAQSLSRAGRVLAVSAERAPAAAAMLQDHIQHALIATLENSFTEAARRQAVELIGTLPFEQSRETLSRMLEPRAPQSLQIAAVTALGNRPEPEVGDILLEHWREYPPDVRKEVITALLSRDARCETFLRRAAADADIVGQIDAAQRTMLLGSRSETIRTLAQQLFAGDDRPRQAVIDAYRPALQSAGSLEKGRDVFTANCSACHKIGDVGTALGPDLTTSQHRTPDVLLTHILDPNRYVLPNYVQYVVLDATGRTYTGMMTAQTATSVTLQREKSAADTLLRANIDEIASTGKSMMPEGLEKSISVVQMADLLAFLQQASASEEDLQTRDFGTLPGLIEPPDAK